MRAFGELSFSRTSLYARRVDIGDIWCTSPVLRPCLFLVIVELGRRGGRVAAFLSTVGTLIPD